MPCSDGGFWEKKELEDLRKALDDRTRWLCAFLVYMKVMSSNEEQFQREIDEALKDAGLAGSEVNDFWHWWEVHQEQDRERREQERKEAEQAEIKRAALAKLTVEERTALNLWNV